MATRQDTDRREQDSSYRGPRHGQPPQNQVYYGCCGRPRHPQPAIPMNSQDDMSEMFDHLPGLTTLQRETAKARYRFLLAEYRYRSWLYAILFYTLRITMTVGSLTVPALLSLKVDGPVGESALYWTTWAISLAVTTSNGLMTLFKLDKRFFMLHGVAERLRTETWQFLTLAGRYSGHYNSDEEPTHANQYVHYCTNIEKIRMRHMDDEYISAGEGDKPKPVQGAATGTAAAHPPAAVSSPSDGGATTTNRPSNPPSVSQVAVPPALPPAGTLLNATFMSPRSADVPTPPAPARSRRPSYNILLAARRAQTPPRVGNQTDGVTTPSTQQDTKEPAEDYVSLPGRDGTAV